MDLKAVAEKTFELIKETGSFIVQEKHHFDNSKVERKGKNDFVSYVDKEAEQRLVKGLSKIIPLSGFLAEEQTAGHDHENYIWIVDPLDGTTNFIHGVAPHSISVALSYKNEVILGAVYELGHNELFHAIKGGHSMINGQPIKVSGAKGLNDALIATGFHTNNFSRLPNQLEVVDYVVRNSHGLRRHGSAAVDLAYVAAGRFDGFFEYALNPWDVAAGAFIVQQAGGKVSDYSGNNNFLFGKEILAASPLVFDDLLQVLKEKM